MTDKLHAANAALAAFAPDSRIERRRGGWFVHWIGPRGAISRRWSTRPGQDFYPPWSRKWAHGGTATTALSQLIRWLRGQPVLPISTWRYWASDTVKLLPMLAVEGLMDSGYPATTPCVLCGEPPGGLDWWSLDDVSGPCCSFRRGCRQTGERQKAEADQ